MSRRASNAPFRISCRAESVFEGTQVASEASSRQLDILWGPELQVQNVPKDTEIHEGKTIKLECPFAGFPKPRIAWVLFQENRGVEKFEGTQTEYEIPAVSPDDSGRWECSARNPKTRVEQRYSQTLSVLRRPVFSSDEYQDIGKNRTRPIIMCSFQHQFSTESFRGIHWIMKNATFERSLDHLRMREPGDLETVSFGRFEAKWTDVGSQSATALLTLNGATNQELNMDFVCQVQNSVGLACKCT